MFGMMALIRAAICPKMYLWVDVLLIKETKKAVLIEFDGKKEWFPKAWGTKIKRNKDNNTIKIKICEYYWARRFS